ncbi:MAG: hypothetical protein HWD61_04025 [Parachlamydiaceae bacterium]|nr:MAG: hypothetical protein HWD61_04025 [Parachlamydiaceae bacterium]
MKIFLKGICTLFVLAFLIQSVPLTATEALIAQQTPPPVQAYPVPPSYYGTQAQYYYNMNNPYANSNAPYGFYGGFYGSPPPPLLLKLSQTKLQRITFTDTFKIDKTSCRSKIGSFFKEVEG